MAEVSPIKAWSGRIAQPTSPSVEAFTTSLPVDRRLFAEDITASRAHARMLRRAGILSAAELRAIDSGLRAIGAELAAATFAFLDSDEDIHMAIERRLFDLAGDAAGKLHTARSRNDQVATDLRLYAKRAAARLMLAVAGLQESLLRRAKEHRQTLMPGYTHLQRAQPVTLAHHLLAHVEMLHRDAGRLDDAVRRADVCPLGSGALAATTLPIDRASVAAELGFAATSANSLDAVSDRDFAVEITAACALLMVHLSRLGEEVVLWTSREFGFAELSDAHATGSSLMPQKKNPDVAELVRGRAARATGDLVTLLTMLKGLPLSYNRDLQEDKQALFDAVDVTEGSLGVMAELVDGIEFRVDAMAVAAGDAELMATDVAEHLVAAGVPFREAHRIVGTAVRSAMRSRGGLGDLRAAQWRAVDRRLGEDTPALLDARRSVRSRDLPGGPGPRSVARQLSRAARLITQTRGRATAILET